MNKHYSDLGFARVDTDRLKRRGYPEAVYCPGKETGQIVKIAKTLLKEGQDLLLTKLEKKVFLRLKKAIPALRYNHPAKLGYYLQSKKTPPARKVVVVSGGTADIPFAEEACVTLEAMGQEPLRLYDVGVAGIHRLMSARAVLRDAGAIIVVAGMEGALASLVSGLVSCPVIAVPTSVGYGASFGGIAPLLTMLNSCAAGVAVVNIDNGFAAGYIASLINRQTTTGAE